MGVELLSLEPRFGLAILAVPGARVRFDRWWVIGGLKRQSMRSWGQRDLRC